MAKYLFEARYTTEGAKGVGRVLNRAKYNLVDRVAQRVVAARAGRMRHNYLGPPAANLSHQVGFEPLDAVAVVEAIPSCHQLLGRNRHAGLANRECPKTPCTNTLFKL